MRKDELRAALRGSPATRGSFTNLKQWQKDFIMYPHVADPQRDCDVLEFVKSESAGLLSYELDSLAKKVTDKTDPSADQYISDMRKRVWRRFKINQESSDKLEDFAKFCGHPSYMLDILLTEIEWERRRGELSAKSELILKRADTEGIHAILKR